jgi:hypothetical protein
VDSIAGANLYAHNLAMRVNKAPHVALRRSSPGSRTRNWVREHVIDALESGSAKNLMQHSLFGKVFLDSRAASSRALTADESASSGSSSGPTRSPRTSGSSSPAATACSRRRSTTYIKTHGKAPDADWILDTSRSRTAPSTCSGR